jgi:succinyl-CoA synthetase alpha subunit
MAEYGTNIVGSVTPGKDGEVFKGKPMFDTVNEVVAETGAEASIIIVPPPLAADSIMKAGDAVVDYCVCITDGLPAQDMIRVKRFMRRYSADRKMVLAGPNCAGTFSPGKAMLGIFPGHIFKKGPVGIVVRSGTLGYEAASQLKELAIGVSTSVGIGGDPIDGSSFRDILELFEKDDETEIIALISEIGGPQEAEATAYIQKHFSKPVVAYVAGMTAPKCRTMSHAGAIVSAFDESASEKIDFLSTAGVTVAPHPGSIGEQPPANSNLGSPDHGETIRSPLPPLACRRGGFAGRKVRGRLQPHGPPLTPCEFHEALGKYDAVLPTETDHLGRDAMYGPKTQTKILGNYGVGFSHIDINNAQEKGIRVTNTPDVLSECTADIAMTLMPMIARRAGEGEREGREPRNLVA